MSWHFLRRLRTEPAFFARMWDAAEDLWPDIRGHLWAVEEGPDGGARVSKYYPPLKLVRRPPSGRPV